MANGEGELKGIEVRTELPDLSFNERGDLVGRFQLDLSFQDPARFQRLMDAQGGIRNPIVSLFSAAAEGRVGMPMALGNLQNISRALREGDISDNQRNFLEAAFKQGAELFQPILTAAHLQREGNLTPELEKRLLTVSLPEETRTRTVRQVKGPAQQVEEILPARELDFRGSLGDVANFGSLEDFTRITGIPPADFTPPEPGDPALTDTGIVIPGRQTEEQLREETLPPAPPPLEDIFGGTQPPPTPTVSPPPPTALPPVVQQPFVPPTTTIPTVPTPPPAAPPPVPQQPTLIPTQPVVPPGSTVLPPAAPPIVTPDPVTPEPIAVTQPVIPNVPAAPAVTSPGVSQVANPFQQLQQQISEATSIADVEKLIQQQQEQAELNQLKAQLGQATSPTQLAQILAARTAVDEATTPTVAQGGPTPIAAPDPRRPGELIEIPVVDRGIPEDVRVSSDRGRIEAEALRQQEQQRQAFEAARALRDERLRDLAGLLSAEEERKFEATTPLIAESAQSAGLLRSSALGEALARERSNLAAQSAFELARVGLEDRDLEVQGIQDILANRQLLQSQALERAFSIEDFEREAQIARDIGAAAAPQVRGGSGKGGALTTGLGGAAVGHSIGGVPGAIIGGIGGLVGGGGK